MEQVAHLLAGAAEADVAERAAEVVAEQPVGEDALVDLAHLPGPGDHAAAVDDRAQPERRRRTRRSAARRRASSRRRGCGRPAAGSPREMPARPAPGERLLRGELEARRAPPPARARAAARPGRRGWSRGRRRRRPPRGRSSRQLKAPSRLVCDRRSEASVEPGEDRGLGRALDHRVEARRRPRRSAGSRTSPWTNSTPASRRRGRFSSEPAPRQVVERDELPARDGARRARRARLPPTNPAPPVIRTRISISGGQSPGDPQAQDMRSASRAGRQASVYRARRCWLDVPSPAPWRSTRWWQSPRRSPPTSRSSPSSAAATTRARC